MHNSEVSLYDSIIFFCLLHCVCYLSVLISSSNSIIQGCW